MNSPVAARVPLIGAGEWVRLPSAEGLLSGRDQRKVCRASFCCTLQTCLGRSRDPKGACKAKQKTECGWAPESPEAVTEHKTVYKTAHTLQSKLLSALGRRKSNEMAVRFKQTSPLLEVQYSSFPSWIHCRERVWKKALNSRNLFEVVSARSGTIAKQVTTYNASYGVLPCFLTFCRFLFRMRLNPEKRPAGPPKSGENPEIVDDVALRERFPPAAPLAGGTTSALFRLRLHHQSTMPDHNGR